MTDQPRTPTEVVDAYHQAWTTGDLTTALGLVHDEAVVHAPGDGVRTKTDWHAYLAGFVPRLTGAPEIERLADGDRVALWYYPQTAVTGSTPACELFTVHDGQITGIRLIFDRMAYVPPGQSAR